MCKNNTPAHLHLSKCSHFTKAKFIPNASSPLSFHSQFLPVQIPIKVVVIIVMTLKNIPTGCLQKTQIYLHLNPWSDRFTTEPSSVSETSENI